MNFPDELSYDIPCPVCGQDQCICDIDSDEMDNYLDDINDSDLED